MMMAVRAVAEAGKLGLQIGESVTNFNDVKKTIAQKEAQLHRRVQLEAFFGKQLAQAASADLAAGQGTVRVLAGASGVKGVSVQAQQSTQSAIFAAQESQRIASLRERGQELRGAIADIPRQKTRARTQVALDITGSLLSSASSLASPMGEGMGGK
jgi:DNA gyrase/topoisomerase IV subunit A